MSSAQTENELAVAGSAAAGGPSPDVSPVEYHPEDPELSDTWNGTGAPRVSSKSKIGFKTMENENLKGAGTSALCESAPLPTMDPRRRESHETSFRAIWPNFDSAVS